MTQSGATWALFCGSVHPYPVYYPTAYQSAFYNIHQEDEIAKQQPKQNAKCLKSIVEDECEDESNVKSTGIRTYM
ncbi:hypothetical protein KIN20_015506 [Parelaphostrongylus tenuis]|uniref:Uncharacterized protein n=1 Tax=Parelaphostrongylus tenuis TaxID=148309 RepID=A0AAD5QPZ7_PARTN|nr:hypothetical protein KIN20_015506 [Parelaphostrongylus tenuis]